VAIDNPPNPWASTAVEYLAEEPPPEMKLQVYEDHSRQVLAQNDSPDVGFRYSVNPYRGCFHACAYCYARPSHELLSFGAGTDFERRIVVKPRAPELLREALSRKSWKRETVVFSGVTDCYQPLEASYQLTRGCLQVCAELSTPAAVITKAPLVERDIDVLLRLAEVAEAHVTVSIPFWDPVTARAIEPYVATPERRLRTVERLARAGLSVGVNVAPIIPGLNDQDMPRILAAAREAGRQLRRLRAAAAAGLGAGGVRGASEEEPTAGGRSSAAPHPRDPRRRALRPALQDPGPRRRSLRRGHRAAVPEHGSPPGTA
jgi:DNA repair photolyase